MKMLRPQAVNLTLEAQLLSLKLSVPKFLSEARHTRLCSECVHMFLWQRFNAGFETRH